jgi:hypothetical protein
MPSPHPELLTSLGEERAGVVTHAQVVEAGVDPSFPSRQVTAGRWQELAPGIYLPSSTPPTPRQRAHAASLHAGPTGVISGRLGCALRGAPGIDAGTGPTTVLVPHRVRRVSTSTVRVVRSRHELDWQVLRVEGHADLRVAPRARCVADAIRAEEALAEARALGSRALRDRELDWALVAAQAARPGPGAQHLSRVVQDIADGVRSPAEGDLHDALLPASRRGRLPPYLLNPDVYLDGVLLGSPDAWFVGLGLGDEQDSREWHGSEDGLDATLARHERFRQAGLLLHHTTPSRFRSNRDAHIRVLQALVAERRGLATPEPRGLVVLARGPLLPTREPWPQVLPSRPR